MQQLILSENLLGSYYSQDLKFLDALTKCTQLEILDFGYNRLGCDLRSSIANLSTNLIGLSLGTNIISGSIPHDIGNLVSLRYLWLNENMLRGSLPISLGKLPRLEGLEVYSNKLSGEISSSLGSITWLETLTLTNKSFEGSIPPSLGNCSFLLRVWLGANNLNGNIPQEIMQIPSLLYLDMSDNFLIGSLPKEVGRNLVGLSVGNNKLLGQLSNSLNYNDLDVSQVSCS